MIDKGLLFCSAQAITADVALTDTIPLTTARKIFQGEPMACFIQVGVAADGTTTDETYEFEVHTDDNASLSSSTELIARAIPYASLTLNSIHSIPVPYEATLETYIGMKADVGGTTPTITITAWLGRMADAQQWTAYADAITIS